MSSIDDFLAHRWEDAKVKLRNLDADFVHKVETVGIRWLEQPSESQIWASTRHELDRVDWTGG